jgi:hypothetical protein
MGYTTVSSTSVVLHRLLNIKIVLARIVDAIDSKLREKVNKPALQKDVDVCHMVFRKHNIIEQSIKQNIQLLVHIPFIDFRKAFDMGPCGKVLRPTIQHPKSTHCAEAFMRCHTWVFHL